MENKFWLKDVEWICETRGVITITHRPTKYFIKEFDGNTPVNDLWSALKKLERIVNEHYQKESEEVNDEVKTADMDDVIKRFSKPIKLSDSCFGTPPTNELNYELRTKALELSLEAFECFSGSTSIFISPPFIEENIIPVANRFYTYITKGE